jgi:hypothetical protein
MRYITALSLAVGLGAAAGAYTSAASAAVYVGVGIAPPVVTVPAPAVAVPSARVIAPYYAPAFYGYGPGIGRGWYGPHYLGARGHWGHPYWGLHRR